MIFLEILGQIVFWSIMLICIILIPIGIPGTFLIVLNGFVYGWLTDFVEVTFGLLGVLLGVAILAEVIEFFIGAATAGKFGASKQAMIGAIVGGFVGAIWMTALMPIVGTLVGAFAGAFGGATLVEYFQTNDWSKAVNVGLGAFLGTLGGKLTKIAAGVGMVVAVAMRVF